MAKKTIKQLADKRFESFKTAEKKEQLLAWLLDQGFIKSKFCNNVFKLETNLQVVIELSIGNEEFVLNCSYRQADGNWETEEPLIFFYSVYPDITTAFLQVRKACRQTINNAQM